MTHDADRLRETFASHEHLAPDPAAVYARVEELSRTYRRRRRGLQAAGGAALGVGLIAGVVNLPALLASPPSDSFPMVAPAAQPSASASAPAQVSPQDDPQTRKEWDAYFSAGYGYDDAVRLAKLWKMTGDVGAVKAEAGRRLLAGQNLPFKPTPTPTESAQSRYVSQKEALQVAAFFDAGYDYDDAAKLARLWHKPTPYDAKVEGGKRVLAGQDLPVQPDPSTGSVTALRVDAFFAAGYDYDDAAKLAKLWKKTTPYDAKAEGGKRLLAGETLPFKP
ncbi:hypothetical protein [Mangrovihabitans endophyticus]|uniref:Uncharacterized protein n=1 Tax=Mangrovihabitans endophyticus TaxID=1751298 RepID=A0A8J3C672_9ACTN|nr:hypothetical protein [Mangrovihabitans endophyticus]GGL12345.1 hypothetical protein GCM10012284_53760 [Mangrovihabitans endophyticus]